MSVPENGRVRLCQQHQTNFFRCGGALVLLMNSFAMFDLMLITIILIVTTLCACVDINSLSPLNLTEDKLIKPSLTT